MISGSPAPSNNKLTQNKFSAVDLRLANASKSMVRERIAFEEGFPKDKDSFIWESIQLVAKDNQGFQDVLKRAEADGALQDDLIEFVCFFILNFCFTLTVFLRLGMQLLVYAAI